MLKFLYTKSGGVYEVCFFLGSCWRLLSGIRLVVIVLLEATYGVSLLVFPSGRQPELVKKIFLDGLHQLFQQTMQGLDLDPGYNLLEN